eukprot:scaffold208264_cov32-Tisochrysis_lutea.AAC.3
MFSRSASSSTGPPPSNNGDGKPSAKWTAYEGRTRASRSAVSSAPTERSASRYTLGSSRSEGPVSKRKARPCAKSVSVASRPPAQLREFCSTRLTCTPAAARRAE